MNFGKVLLISLFVLSRLMSAMSASRRTKEEDAWKKSNEWFDVYNHDDLYNYEDCNAQLDMRDLDKDFDWRAPSSNVVEVRQKSKAPLSARKAIKRKNKNPEQGKKKPVSSKEVKKSNSSKERRLPFKYPEDVEHVVGKLKKSNQKTM